MKTIFIHHSTMGWKYKVNVNKNNIVESSSVINMAQHWSVGRSLSWIEKYYGNSVTYFEE